MFSSQKFYGDKMRHDIISDVLSALKNADAVGKREVLVPFSKLAKEALLLLQKMGFVNNFEEIDNKKGGLFKVELKGEINNCGSIRPRYAVRIKEFEKYERRYLPAAGFGHLIVSTSKGLMVQEDAREKGLGGRLIAFIY